MNNEKKSKIISWINFVGTAISIIANLVKEIINAFPDEEKKTEEK